MTWQNEYTRLCLEDLAGCFDLEKPKNKMTPHERFENMGKRLDVLLAPAVSGDTAARLMYLELSGKYLDMAKAFHKGDGFQSAYSQVVETIRGMIG